MSLLVPLVVTFGLLAPAAEAAPPPNDDRAAAQALGALPATVRGTTVDATREPGEPPGCSVAGGSVWYSLSGAAARDLVLELDAAGDLDAVVDVYRPRPLAAERDHLRRDRPTGAAGSRWTSSSRATRRC